MEFQVFDPVVEFVPILVVDDLSLLKKPAEVFHHHKPMFENVAFGVGARMLLEKNEFIPMAYEPAAPVGVGGRAFFAKKMHAGVSAFSHTYIMTQKGG
jgi:hypothetical protein